MFCRACTPRITTVRPVGSFQRINVARPGTLQVSIKTYAFNVKPTTLKILANTTLSRGFADQKKDAKQPPTKEQPKDNKPKQETAQQSAKDNKPQQGTKDNKPKQEDSKSKAAQAQKGAPADVKEVLRKKLQDALNAKMGIRTSSAKKDDKKDSIGKLSEDEMLMGLYLERHINDRAHLMRKEHLQAEQAAIDEMKKDESNLKLYPPTKIEVDRTLYFRTIASVIVERPPLVMIAPPIVEEYAQHKAQMLDHKAKAVEEAALKRMEVELKFRAKKAKAKKKDEKAAAAPGQKPKTDEQQQQESEDEYKDIFDIGEMTTPDDERDNKRSVFRALPQRLYLIVRRAKTTNWVFPQTDYIEKDGDHLRTTAERILREECGQELNVWFRGNAPRGHYTFTMTPEDQQKYKFQEAAVFFYRASYLDGNPVLNKTLTAEYLWVTKEELQKYFTPELYNHVQDILL